MNKVILSGRLCADPELRHTQNDTAVCSYRLAVEREYKKESQPEADFISCTAWRNSAEFAAKYLRKGMKILIEGSIQSGSYEKDGQTIYTTDVIVNRHEFCESKKSDASTKAPTKNSSEYEDQFVEMTGDDGELPF